MERAVLTAERQIVLVVLMLIAATVLVVVGVLFVDLLFAEGTEGTTCTITWQANTESDLAGYRLYTQPTLASAQTRLLDLPTGTQQTTCADAKAPLGQNYFTLTAYDKTGNESGHTPGAPFVLILPDTTPPKVPTGLQVVSIVNGVATLWAPLPPSGHTYELARWNTTTRQWVLVGPIAGTLKNTLPSTGRRLYQLCARNTVGRTCNLQQGVWAGRG